MAVLVTGSTGTIGSRVVGHLTGHGVEVRALTRSPDRAELPDGATAVAGSLTDPAALRTALEGVDGVFLLSAVTPDALTATLAALSLIREAGVRDVVYLSVVSADRAWTVPHFAAKAAAERAIDELGMAATILRPGYYMQNGLRERERLQGGVYAPAIGNRGVHMVDTGDLAEAAAVSLERRLAAASALPTEVLDVADPQPRTGDGLASLWGELLGREVRYGGDEVDRLERQLASAMPDLMAWDLRSMMEFFERAGTTVAGDAQQRLADLLGRAPRTYREFAEDAAADWRG